MKFGERALRLTLPYNQLQGQKPKAVTSICKKKKTEENMALFSCRSKKGKKLTLQRGGGKGEIDQQEAI